MTNHAAGPRRLSAEADERATAARRDVYFAREPIVDRDGLLCGFEARLRATGALDAARLEASAAPALGTALAGHPAYLDVTREQLFDDALLRLPPTHVRFELPPDIEVDQALVERLVALHGRRYRFVLDHVTQADDAFARLLPYAESVKIDMGRISPTLLPKFAGVLKSAGKILIATGMSDVDVYENARELGFDRFQGYGFMLPETGLHRASASREALLRLLHLLADDPAIVALEAELKPKPAFALQLVRLVSGSRFGPGRKVTTLREAINAAGTDRVTRWARLLLYADARKIALEDDPLLQLAGTRARFMELAAGRPGAAGRATNRDPGNDRNNDRDAAFLVGVFSLVHAVLGGPPETTLDALGLARTVREAILRHTGPLGQLLELIEALERADWTRVDDVCARLNEDDGVAAGNGFDAASAAALALEAADWAGLAERHAEAAGFAPIED